MQRYCGVLSNASPMRCCLLLAVHIVLSSAGPLGPLPNITSLDLGIKEDSCALGDVVYMSGDEFPGATPCEKCKCAGGNVQCEKQQCEPRPGCKAVHRPDHCCPTYQCECEQEGRIYGNGEKLVDPQDPCRVCYCQGGEVVCRRIACFLRDDCQPRLVEGRCCPEYDNCPLRGVTTLQGISTAAYSTSTTTESNMSVIPVVAEPVITIKEITPVSEIPIITDVKVKEILPSSSMDVAEYSSSKSQLTPREAAVDGTSSINDLSKNKTPASSEASSEIKLSSEAISNKKNNDTTPSKINLSTQEFSNSEGYPFKLPTLPIMMGPPAVPASLNPLTSKAPIIEEEDQSLFDHNPAFPPIPDDLSVIGNHEDEILPEQNLDNEHIYMHVTHIASHDKPSTESPVISESTLTTNGFSIITENSPEVLLKTSTLNNHTSDLTTPRENSMLNLRSVLPTEILNVPSLIPDVDTTVESDSTTESPITDTFIDSIITSTYKAPNQLTENITKNPININEFSATTESILSPQSTENNIGTSARNSLPSSVELTSENHPSSLLIETSDQNPHDVAQKMLNDSITLSTADPFKMEWPSTSSSETNSDTNMQTETSAQPDISVENIETTEFIRSFGSQESVTDNIELIKISPDTDKSSPLIESPKSRKNDVINDLIKLVGDVASISDHTDVPDNERQSISTTISDSEELIPVNTGYKSKNNKNWNLNSITEVPLKTKSSQNKQKVVEIEDDDADIITDFPPPHDRIEPTTKQPIIDNVSDPQNKAESDDRKDIEIITKSYVPTINRKPTKVIMEKSNDREISNSSAVTTEGQTKSSVTPTADDLILSLNEFTTHDGFASAEIVTEVGSLDTLDTTE